MNNSKISIKILSILSIGLATLLVSAFAHADRSHSGVCLIQMEQFKEYHSVSPSKTRLALRRFEWGITADNEAQEKSIGSEMNSLVEQIISKSLETNSIKPAGGGKSIELGEARELAVGSQSVSQMLNGPGRLAIMELLKERVSELSSYRVTIESQKPNEIIASFAGKDYLTKTIKFRLLSKAQ